MTVRTKDSLDGLDGKGDSSTAGFQIYDDAFRKLIGEWLNILEEKHSPTTSL
jgi:hypothetical protein